MFFKISVLQNFSILTGKHLCWSLFLIMESLQHRCFPVNIAKFLKTAFSIEHLLWLLLFLVFCDKLCAKMSYVSHFFCILTQCCLLRKSKSIEFLIKTIKFLFSRLFFIYKSKKCQELLKTELITYPGCLLLIISRTAHEMKMENFSSSSEFTLFSLREFSKLLSG